MSSWRLVLSLHAKKTTDPICMNINEEKPEDKPAPHWFTKTRCSGNQKDILKYLQMFQSNAKRV